MKHSVRIWLQISGLTPANWSRMCFSTRNSTPIKAPQDWRRRFKVESPGMNTPPSRGTLKDWATRDAGTAALIRTRDTGKPLWDQTALYVMSADKTMHLSQVRAGSQLYCCCRRPSPHYCAWHQSSSPVSLPDTRTGVTRESGEYGHYSLSWGVHSRGWSRTEWGPPPQLLQRKQLKTPSVCTGQGKVNAHALLGGMCSDT